MNNPFHKQQFSVQDASNTSIQRNKTLGLCLERLFLNSLLSDTQRKQIDKIKNNECHATEDPQKKNNSKT